MGRECQGDSGPGPIRRVMTPKTVYRIHCLIQTEKIVDGEGQHMIEKQVKCVYLNLKCLKLSTTTRVSRH